MKSMRPAIGSLLKYSHIIGTGGIGSGLFFKLDGNHTIGRNESRLGRLLNFKDYCKLHIITHYIAVLLNAGSKKGFEVYPIGKIGDDDSGKRLLAEIKTTGMDSKYISMIPDCSTLSSVCFQYPDNTGCNITTLDSASSRVTPEDITLFFKEFNGNGNDELILAAPEVPLDARIKLLQFGSERGSFNIAALLSSEVEAFNELHGFEMVDLLSINIDEARSIAQINDESTASKTVIDSCINKLVQINQDISVLITDGPNGSYSYKDGYVEFTPILDVDVVATAGAGDTFLAGTIVGLCCKLPLSKGGSDAYFSETPIISAVELGTLLAALSVTSPDAIYQAADARLLYEFSMKKGVLMSTDFLKLFECFHL